MALPPDFICSLNTFSSFAVWNLQGCFKKITYEYIRMFKMTKRCYYGFVPEIYVKQIKCDFMASNIVFNEEVC